MQEISNPGRVLDTPTEEERYILVEDQVYPFQVDSGFITTARWANKAWLIGVSLWGIALAARAIVAIADGVLSSVEISQTLLGSIVFWFCLYCKPVEGIGRLVSEYSLSQFHKAKSVAAQWFNKTSNTAESRMRELRNYHLISQEYVLPFPYLCQIYHLLNLKHLEHIHSFSLNNLKVLKISELQPTEIGGSIKFQTVLESPVNTLRIWRQPIVEVDLILHTPYTVELNIPAYNNKRIIVIFNVLPTAANEHKLFIDIYSNLQWPRPILQVFLHIAAYLTVFEDFPYLQKLASRNLDRAVQSCGSSTRDTTWLFRRFAELYGPRMEQVGAPSFTESMGITDHAS